MSEWLLQHEIALRCGVFVGLFVLLAALQSLRPFRKVSAPWRRWARHLVLATLGTLLVRLLFPVVAIAVAAEVDAADFGLLQLGSAPLALQVLGGVIVLDLIIYLQHRIFHGVPWLWRLHRMHHSDTEFEVSTAIRFHPLEIALSMLIKIAMIVICGIPALAVLLFEILLNATSLFSHADISLSRRLDRALRWVLVTPDMHRIHHSTLPVETNSNYGFCLSLWDRLFESYRDTALRDPAEMPIGLGQFRESREQRLLPLLSQPFR